MSSKFASPFMAKSPLGNTKRIQRLEDKIEETRRKAFMRGTPEYTDEEYEETRSEKRAQKKLARQEKRLDRVVKRNSALDRRDQSKKEKSIVEQ